MAGTADVPGPVAAARAAAKRVPAIPARGVPGEERGERCPDLPDESRLGAPERLEAVHVDLQRAEGAVGGVGLAGHSRAEGGQGVEGRLDGRGVGDRVGREEDGLRGEPVGPAQGDAPANAEGERGGAGVEDDAVIPRPPAEDQRPGGRDAGIALPREPEGEVRPGEVEEAHRSIPGAPARWGGRVGVRLRGVGSGAVLWLGSRRDRCLARDDLLAEAIATTVAPGARTAVPAPDPTPATSPPLVPPTLPKPQEIDRRASSTSPGLISPSGSRGSAIPASRPSGR